MSIAIKTVTRSLPCKLTDVEVQMAGTELAGTIEAIEAEKDRQSEIKADMKSRMTALQTKVQELTYKVSHREEMREIDVQVILIPDTMLVNEVRLDTGEITKTRRAEDDELQSSFDD